MSASARFAVFLTVVLAIWLLEHLYIGWRLWSVPMLDTAVARRALLVVLAAGFLTYPLGRLGFAVGGHGAGRALEYAGAVWMGTVFLVFAALLLVDLVTLWGVALRQWAPTVRGAAAALALAAAVVAWLGAFAPPRTLRIEVALPGLDASADGLRLVQVSDVHLGTILGVGRLRTILERVAAVQPDAVVITGDLIDGDAGVVEELLPKLRVLRAPRGVYAVLGNHEYYAGRDRSRRLLEDAGYTVLDNAAVELAPGLWLAGVPDARGSAQTGTPEADLAAALAEVPPADGVVLLQHSPEDEERAAAAGVDLMLNGHTHGGQIWPFHYLVRRAYAHLAGVHRVGEMTQVVSRGAGQWGPPMRLGAPSDIVLVTLRAAAVPPASS